MSKKKLKGLMNLLETISNFRGKTYLMISELIDNSISSWIDDGGNETVNGLEITLDIDFKASDENLHKIQVIDNAYGMDENELEIALTLGMKTQEKDSGLSLFGMGLKQSAFWLGKKLSVITKKENVNGYIAIIDLPKLKRENNQYDEEYDLDIAPNTMPRGTIIEISNIRNGVERNHKYYMNQLPKILGWRYNRYIKEGLVIKLRFSKNKIKEEFIIKKFFPVTENLTNWAKSDKREVAVVKKEIIAKLEEELSDTKYENFKHQLLSRIVNDKDLVFPIELIFKGIKTVVYYGILSSKHRGGRKEFTDLGYTKVNGITIYQANRAIYCGPNDTSHQTYFKPKDNRGAGLIFQIRLFGFMFVDEYVKKGYLEVDSNKQAFKWDDTEFKKYLDQTMENFKSSGISRAVEVIGRYQNSKTVVKGPKNTKSNLSKIDKALIDRISKFKNIKTSIYEDELVEISDGSLITSLVIEDVKVGKYVERIQLIEDTFDDNSFLRQGLEDDTLVIRINTNHKIWDPYLIQGNEDIKRNIVYPLSIMVGIAQYTIQSEEFEAYEDFDLWVEALNQLGD